LPVIQTVSSSTDPTHTQKERIRMKLQNECRHKMQDERKDKN